MERITHVAAECDDSILIADSHGELLRYVKDLGLSKVANLGYWTNSNNFVTGKQALILPTPRHFRIIKSFMRKIN